MYVYICNIKNVRNASQMCCEKNDLGIFLWVEKSCINFSMPGRFVEVVLQKTSIVGN